MNIKRIGAINWDAALPKETYFGGYMLNSLGNKEYCARLPYFALKTENGYDFPAPTQELYDRELEYAKEYGIDFFLYCWYPENDGKEKTVGNEEYPFLAGKTAELNAKRKLYQSSKLENKINYCAIIFDIHAYSEDETDALIEAMKDEHYEKINGRPIVVIYRGGSEVRYYNGAVADFVKKKTEEAGIDPYFVLIAAANYDGSKTVPPRDIDAVSLYAVWSAKSNSYKALADAAVEENKRQTHFGLPVIPILSAGWNSSPRMDHPVPWADSYSTNGCVDEKPDRESFGYAFEKTEEWVNNNKEIANTGCAFVYAWNEFEEGGYICPTLGADGKPDTSVAEAFFKARNSAD